MTDLADAHLHLFSHGYHRQFVDRNHADLQRYESIRRRHAIAAGLVVGYEAEGIDPSNNRYLRGLAVDHRWMTTVAFVGNWPAPGVDSLERLFEAGHRGIALYCMDRAAADAVATWPGECWRLLDRRQALVSINARPEAHSRLIGLARAAPRCRFLFSHLGLPGVFRGPPEKAQVVDRLGALFPAAEAGNCWVKLSGLYAVGQHAEPVVGAVLDAFGPDRCLWGSDFSPSLDHGEFEQTLAVPGLNLLSPAERRQVMGKNLRDLLETNADD